MSKIPLRCPKCSNKAKWKERINPLTTGIPVGSGTIRFSFISIRGLFAGPIKKKLGFHKVTYRCKNCGYEETYELPE